MSYRSQVGLVITDEALKVLTEKHVHILDDADQHLTKNHDEKKYHLFVWDWINWNSYLNDDINVLEIRLDNLPENSDEELDRSDWKLLRIGEETGDIDVDGDLSNDPFHLGHETKLSFIEEGTEDAD